MTNKSFLSKKIKKLIHLKKYIKISFWFICDDFTYCTDIFWHKIGNRLRPRFARKQAHDQNLQFHYKYESSTHLSESLNVVISTLKLQSMNLVSIQMHHRTFFQLVAADRLEEPSNFVLLRMTTIKKIRFVLL